MAIPQHRNMVTLNQIEALIEFMEANPELALGRCNRTTEGRSKAQRMWQEVSSILNSVAPNCTSKEPKEWRAFYSEFKSKLMKKIKSNRAELCKTGGGKAQTMDLTPLQERLYSILGRDVGDPLPGVQHNPLQQEQSQGLSTGDSYINTHSSQHVISETEPGTGHLTWNFEVETDERHTMDREQSPSITTWQILPDAGSPPEPSTWRSPLSAAAASFTLPVASNEPSTSRAAHQPVVSPTRRPLPLMEPSTDRRERVERDDRHATTPSQPARRRRQRRTVESQHRSSLTEAQSLLSELEQSSSRATMEHALATNRLAAAIERLADTMAQPLRIVIENGGSPAKKRCRRRRMIESDSD